LPTDLDKEYNFYVEIKTIRNYTNGAVFKLTIDDCSFYFIDKPSSEGYSCATCDPNITAKTPRTTPSYG